MVIQKDLEFDLTIDIQSLKSKLKNYILKHKFINSKHFDNCLLYSRLSFILFQFKNIFFS